MLSFSLIFQPRKSHYRPPLRLKCSFIIICTWNTKAKLLWLKTISLFHRAIVLASPQFFSLLLFTLFIPSSYLFVFHAVKCLVGIVRWVENVTQMQSHSQLSTGMLPSSPQLVQPSDTMVIELLSRGGKKNKRINFISPAGVDPTPRIIWQLNHVLKLSLLCARG